MREQEHEACAAGYRLYADTHAAGIACMRTRMLQAIACMRTRMLNADEAIATRPTSQLVKTEDKG